MVGLKHERAAAGLQPFPVAFQHRRSDLTGGQRQVAGLNRQPGADPQPHQIEGVRQRPGLVKVVDAPHQPPGRVPPGSEILEVNIADGRHRQTFRKRSGDAGPALHVAVEGAAQEFQWAGRHALVLGVQIVGQKPDMALHPGFIRLGGLHDTGKLGGVQHWPAHRS